VLLLDVFCDWVGRWGITSWAVAVSPTGSVCFVSLIVSVLARQYIPKPSTGPPWTKVWTITFSESTAKPTRGTSGTFERVSFKM
jgi:hypothetical protein